MRVTPICSPTSVSFPISSPRHLKLPNTPRSGFIQEGILSPSANSPSPSPCSRTPNFHSFTRALTLRWPVQGRTEQNSKVPPPAALARPASTPAPRPLRSTRSQARLVPWTPRTSKYTLCVCHFIPALGGGRLAPPGVQGEPKQEWRKSHHSPAAPERSQTRNRTAVELPPQKPRHARLPPSPAYPTFTLSIAVGVAPKKILHIRHCRARQLSSPGAAPRLSLRHGTNETR